MIQLIISRQAIIPAKLDFIRFIRNWPGVFWLPGSVISPLKRFMAQMIPDGFGGGAIFGGKWQGRSMGHWIIFVNRTFSYQYDRVW